MFSALLQHGLIQSTPPDPPIPYQIMDWIFRKNVVILRHNISGHEHSGRIWVGKGGRAVYFGPESADPRCTGTEVHFPFWLNIDRTMISAATPAVASLTIQLGKK